MWFHSDFVVPIILTQREMSNSHLGQTGMGIVRENEAMPVLCELAMASRAVSNDTYFRRIRRHLFSPG